MSISTLMKTIQASLNKGQILSEMYQGRHLLFIAATKTNDTRSIEEHREHLISLHEAMLDGLCTTATLNEQLKRAHNY